MQLECLSNLQVDDDGSQCDRRYAIKKFGTKWAFLTPDYVYGDALQAAFSASCISMPAPGPAVPPARHGPLFARPERCRGVLAARPHRPDGRRGPGQQPAPDRALRARRGHGYRRRAVRAGEHPGGDRRGAHRVVDDGMVVEPAGCPAGQGFRRGDPQSYRQGGERAQLVRLCRDPHPGARRQ